MNLALAEQIANAVLYEGHILYPYRPSAVKNRQRWTFGAVFPQASRLVGEGSEAGSMQTECLVEGSGHTMLDVRVRFLHLQERSVGELDPPLADLPAGEAPAFRPVAALRVRGKLIQTWQESVEREVLLPGLRLDALRNGPQRRAFTFPAGRQLEAVRDPGGSVAGVIIRQQQPLAGAVEVAAEEAAPGLVKVGVRIANETPLDDAGAPARNDAVLHAFVSTHTLLTVQDGAFVSLLEPPDEWRDVAAGCRNVGTWPVLVGEGGARDMLLSSPIILYDYPQIAPESAGDLFDGTEIDEILTLRILTLTDAEKEEVRQTDDRARALLERTEMLPPEVMLRLHGTLRDAPWALRPAEDGP